MIEERILVILEKRMSGMIARGLIRRCTTAMGVQSGELDVRHLPEFLRRLEVGVRLFVSPESQGEVTDEIRKLGSVEAPRRTTISIEGESDMARARAAARALALELGAGVFVAQKVMTAVSELARNIALYARSGYVELIPTNLPQPRLKVIAADRGPGIANLKHVLSGEYKSKTGLGRGLLAVRRIADFFDIETGSRGTTVQAEFVL